MMKTLIYTPLLFVLTVALGCSQGSTTPTPAAIPESNSNKQAEPAPKKSFTHVVTGDSEYYVGGPQQASPPDGTFATGTKVRLIKNAGSYSIVESATGVQAYVSTDAIREVEGVKK
jgi:hypothetical protein